MKEEHYKRVLDMMSDLEKYFGDTSNFTRIDDTSFFTYRTMSYESRSSESTIKIDDFTEGNLRFMYYQSVPVGNVFKFNRNNKTFVYISDDARIIYDMMCNDDKDGLLVYENRVIFEKI